jgi:hypothetical protein
VTDAVAASKGVSTKISGKRQCKYSIPRGKSDCKVCLITDLVSSRTDSVAYDEAIQDATNIYMNRHTTTCTSPEGKRERSKTSLHLNSFSRDQGVAIRVIGNEQEVMCGGCQTPDTNFELIRQAPKGKRGRQVRSWAFRASAVHQRRGHPGSIIAPSPPRDASCAHAISVYHEPQGFTGTDQTTAYGVGPITCAVSENVPVRPGRLRLTGAPQEKRHENGVIGFHTKSHSVQVSCQKNGIFSRPSVQITSRWKIQTLFLLFLGFYPPDRGYMRLPV